MFPGFDGGAEWGGAAFDPESGLLFVNSNEMPWIIKLIPNNDTSLYNSQVRDLPSRGPHRRRRRRRRSSTSAQKHDARRDRRRSIRQGTGRMPAFPDMGARNINDVAEFLITGNDKGNDPKLADRSEPT